MCLGHIPESNCGADQKYGSLNEEKEWFEVLHSKFLLKILY